MSDKVIIIGVSAGGFKALATVFSNLNANLTWPILVVQHMGEDAGDYLAVHLNTISKLSVVQAGDKTRVVSGSAYIAPGGYHMLLEDDMVISLSVDERVSYSRPSIDVLFESAAEVCNEQVIGIVLTGANSDGAQGARVIKEYGGQVIAQDPEEAESPTMPLAAIKTNCVDLVLGLKDIADYINQHCVGS